MTLKEKALQGVKWTTLSSIFLIIFQLLQLIILGRMLDSYQFGLMSMVLIIIGFADIFSDMGISNAIIHNQTINYKELSSLYWANIIIGCFVSVIIYTCSPFIADLFHEENLVSLLRLISVVFFITPFGQQYRALLQKNLQFNSLAKIETASAFLGLLTSILLAYLEKGVYALVWGQIINVIARTGLLILIGFNLNKIFIHFKLEELSKFMSFGFYQAAESTVNYFNSRIDSIIIGRYLGSISLGYYTMAFNIINLPSTKINPIITKVAFPLFSKIQNEKELLKKNYLKLLKVVSIINFPIFFGLYVISTNLIPVVLGEKWIPSVDIIQILCGVGLLRSIGNPVGALLMAVGKVKLSFNFNAIKTITQIPGVILGAIFGGIKGVALVYLFLQILYFLFSYFYLIRKVLGRCFKNFIFNLFPAFISSFIMLGSLMLIANIFDGTKEILLISIQIFVGVIVYSLAIFILEKDLIRDNLKGIYSK